MGKGVKTEHAGAKNGGGHWGPRAEAKSLSRSKRRTADKKAVQQGVRERLHDPSELEFDDAARALRSIQETLWPGGDRDHEWDSDTIDAVANILTDAGLGPDYSR